MTSKPAPSIIMPTEVLADVVDVALDGADHHFADTRRAGFGQQWLENGHAALHRVGSQQHFGHEEDPVAEILADDGHAANQRLGEDLVRFPLALKKNIHTLFDLFFETVVEVIKHLLDKLFIVQFRKDDVVFFV